MYVRTTRSKMTFMDATQILAGLAIGSAIGGVIGFILANTAARARTAGVDAIRLECETLQAIIMRIYF